MFSIKKKVCLLDFLSLVSGLPRQSVRRRLLRIQTDKIIWLRSSHQFPGQVCSCTPPQPGEHPRGVFFPPGLGSLLQAKASTPGRRLSSPGLPKLIWGPTVWWGNQGPHADFRMFGRYIHLNILSETLDQGKDCQSSRFWLEPSAVLCHSWCSSLLLSPQLFPKAASCKGLGADAEHPDARANRFACEMLLLLYIKINISSSGENYW